MYLPSKALLPKALPPNALPPKALPVAAVAVLAALATFSAGAQAQSRRAAPGYAYVTAESRYRVATVTAPVRKGPAGRLEVGLPGGTWIECRFSCSDTLRRETVDFWEERGRPRGGGDGPGYLHFRF